MNEIQDEIQRFIVEDIALRHGIPDVAVDEDLIRRGVVDSLGVQEVVAFCENRYGIRVDAADLVPENFRTVQSLAAYVESKRASRAQGGRRFRIRKG
jgi:acyl carrier protein